MIWPWEKNPFKVLEHKFHLKRTSGDNEQPGVHAKGSYHYRPAPWGGVEAYDYGDSVTDPKDAKAAAKYLVAKANAHQLFRGKNLREVFYGHIDYVVKDNVVWPWSSFDPGGKLRAEHMNHLHVAMDG